MGDKQSSFGNWSLHSQQNLRLLHGIVWLITICAGFLQVWAVRFSLTPDGVCYLDIASAYIHGDWKNAVNAYWSPGFSWLLSLGLALFHPKLYWESTVLHLVNFVALLVSLLSFEFFFRVFMQTRLAASEEQELPEWGWWALGYGLFLSTSFFVLKASINTPDIWVAALTYLAAGLILRIGSDSGGWRLFATLGMVLGLAYLTKTFYFPMSFVFLLTAWFATKNPRKTLKQAAVGFLVFFLVAGPWITALSRAKNRFTFGDVGKLALIICIDQLPQHSFWQGENGTGPPRHPVRQLMANPRLYEFATPVWGTYPPAFDLSYWMEGAHLHFTMKGLFSVVRQSAGTMFLFLMDQAEYFVGLLFLFFLAQRQTSWAASLRERWFLWLPPLIACLSYVMVLVEGRYVAPFILLLWISAFSCFLSLPSRLQGRAVVALVLAMLSVTGLRIAKFGVSDIFGGLAQHQNTDYEVAEGLRSLGIRPGDAVAGLSRVAEAHWARLAGVRIVAEIPLGNEESFWTAPPDLQRKVLETVAGTGAKAIVTHDSPPSAINAGWTALGTTGYYALLLSPQHASRPVP